MAVSGLSVLGFRAWSCEGFRGSPGSGFDIGAWIIRIGFWGPL